MPPMMIGFVLGIGVFIVFTLLSFAAEGRRQAGIAFALVTLVIIIDLEPIRSSDFFKSPKVSFAEGSSTAARNVRLVDFKTKPNVYLVSFDALVPRKITEMFFEQSENVYHDMLDSRFRVFRNMFSNATPTRESLNAMLALDLEYFYQGNPATLEYGPKLTGLSTLFRGGAPSPLLQIFKHNGYQTNTLYRHSYFGEHKGLYVDNYYINMQRSAACEFIDEDINHLVFFGACRIISSDWGRNLITSIIDTEFGNKLSQLEYLLSKMRAGVADGRPQIFFGYIYHPGHSPLDYNHNDIPQRDLYRDRYAKNAPTTAKIIETLVDFIQEEDEGAILAVFGDHGTWLTRGAKILEDPKFFILDRYAVLGGIYPPQACGPTFDKDEKSGFTTIMTLARRLVQCLAGGEDPLTVDPPDSILQAEIDGTPVLFKDFLFE